MGSGRVRPALCTRRDAGPAYQGVEHKRVIDIRVRILHHDGEQGVQRVLEELRETRGREGSSIHSQHRANTSPGTFTALCPQGAATRGHGWQVTVGAGEGGGGGEELLYLDDLPAVHVHQVLEVPGEQAGLRAPLEQPQQVHWAGGRDTQLGLTRRPTPPAPSGPVPGDKGSPLLAPRRAGTGQAPVVTEHPSRLSDCGPIVPGAARTPGPAQRLLGPESSLTSYQETQSPAGEGLVCRSCNRAAAAAAGRELMQQP